MGEKSLHAISIYNPKRTCLSLKMQKIALTKNKYVRIMCVLIVVGYITLLLYYFGAERRTTSRTPTIAEETHPVLLDDMELRKDEKEDSPKFEKFLVGLKDPATLRQEAKTCNFRGFLGKDEICECGELFKGDKCENNFYAAREKYIEKKWPGTSVYCGKKLSMTSGFTNEHLFQEYKIMKKFLDKKKDGGFFRDGMNMLDFCGGCGALAHFAFKEYDLKNVTYVSFETSTLAATYIRKAFEKYDVISLQNSAEKGVDLFGDRKFDLIQTSFCFWNILSGDWTTEDPRTDEQQCEWLRKVVRRLKVGGVWWVPLWSRTIGSKRDVILREKIFEDCLQGENDKIEVTIETEGFWEFFEFEKQLYTWKAPENKLMNTFVTRKS